MIDTNQPTSRETLDSIIRRTINTYRWAVFASFAFIGLGFVIAAFTNQDVDDVMGSPLRLLKQIADLRASGFLGVGIGIMVLTPIVMIASAAVDFIRAGDNRYGLITTAVAIVLSLSIAISFVIG